MAIFSPERGEQCEFARTLESLGKVGYIGVRSTTPRYKSASLTSRREKRHFKSLRCEQELYRAALRTGRRTAMERNELCSLPGYWHSCRVVNRTWHLPEWNQWLSVRNLGTVVQPIVHSRDFAKLSADRSLRVGRCPLLNRRSRLESRAFAFFRREEILCRGMLLTNYRERGHEGN